VETAAAVLGETLARYGEDVWLWLPGRVPGARLICRSLGTPFVNEVICQALAVRHLRPTYARIIEMGAKTAS